MRLEHVEGHIEGINKNVIFLNLLVFAWDKNILEIFKNDKR